MEANNEAATKAQRVNSLLQEAFDKINPGRIDHDEGVTGVILIRFVRFEHVYITLLGNVSLGDAHNSIDEAFAAALQKIKRECEHCG